MLPRPLQASPLVYARWAGALYLVIIVCGIFTEVAVRSALIVPGDAPATAANVRGAAGLFRFGFFTDSLVFLSDAALAVLLYVLFRPVSRTLALVAAAFRLTQTAVLALNLVNHHAALLLLDGGPYAAFGAAQRDALVYLALDVHGHGYDLGLLFFGVHCALLGYLVVRSDFMPKVLGVLLAGAAFTYLAGSYARFLFPASVRLVEPLYVVALIAELSLCGWLLVKGVDVPRWEQRSREA